MKTIPFAAILVCTCILFSCQNRTDKNIAESQILAFAENPLAGKIISKPEEIVIDLKNNREQLLDEFIDSLSFIKLETRDDNLIGVISQIVFADSLIFIVDNTKARAIFVFDRQGRFKNKIGNIGNGPGEYVSIKNIAIVPDKNQIAVFDGQKETVLYYHYSGEYIHSERNQFGVNYLEFLSSGYKVFDVSGMSLGNAVLNEYRDSTLIVTNTDNEIMYGACRDFYKEGKFNYVMHPALKRFGDEIYYSPNFSNMIYRVGDSCLTALYHIDIKGGMPPLNDNITSEIFSEYTKRYAYFNGIMIELKDYTYINLFGTQNPGTFVIYSHAKKRVVYYSKSESNNPAFIFFALGTPKARYQDNTIVVDIPAYTVNAWKAELYRNVNNREVLDKLYEGLDEDDNHVLFFYQLKNDL